MLEPLPARVTFPCRRTTGVGGGVLVAGVAGSVARGLVVAPVVAATEVLVLALGDVDVVVAAASGEALRGSSHAIRATTTPMTVATPPMTAQFQEAGWEGGRGVLAGLMVTHIAR